MRGRVLIIAGSDPSGGAGVQADIKTVTALGGYAMAAITALTAQNTTGVAAVQAVDADFVEMQIKTVIADIAPDAVKIGMVADGAGVLAIRDALQHIAAETPIVLDPVLVATSGDALAGEGVAGALLRELVPRAALVTPNSEELAALTGRSVASPDDAAEAAQSLLQIHRPGAVLAKGGHLGGDDVVDVLATQSATQTFRRPRIASTATHGTGCTLSSAIATGLAQGAALAEAVERAIEYVRTAMISAPGFGAGAGPLNHAHPLDRE